MALFSVRLGIATAATVVAAVLAGQLHAQPKKDKPIPIEASNAASNATTVCASIWASKDHEDLESDYREFQSNMREILDGYQKGRRELVDNIQAVKNELEVVSIDGFASSAAKVAAKEHAQDKGLLSKATAKSVAVTLWEDSNSSKEAELRAKLTALRAEQAALQRRLIGWFAYATMVNECFEDQMKYVKDPKNQATVAAPPTPVAPQNTGDITTVKAKMTGGWHANCVYDKSTYPVDGRFSLELKGNGTLGAAFVDGNATSVTGTVKSGGIVTGAGTLTMQGTVIRVSLQGKIDRNKRGEVFGYGTFQSNDGGDIKCTGTWRG